MIEAENLFDIFRHKDRHPGLKDVYREHENHILNLHVFDRWVYGWPPGTIRGNAYGVYFHIQPDPRSNTPDFEVCLLTLDRIRAKNYTPLRRIGFPKGWC